MIWSEPAAFGGKSSTIEIIYIYILKTSRGNTETEVNSV